MVVLETCARIDSWQLRSTRSSSAPLNEMHSYGDKWAAKHECRTCWLLWVCRLPSSFFFSFFLMFSGADAVFSRWRTPTEKKNYKHKKKSSLCFMTYHRICFSKDRVAGFKNRPFKMHYAWKSPDLWAPIGLCLTTMVVWWEGVIRDRPAGSTTLGSAVPACHSYLPLTGIINDQRPTQE